MSAHDEVVAQTNPGHLKVPKPVEYKACGTQSIQVVEGLASATNSWRQEIITELYDMFHDGSSAEVKVCYIFTYVVRAHPADRRPSTGASQPIPGPPVVLYISHPTSRFFNKTFGSIISDFPHPISPSHQSTIDHLVGSNLRTTLIFTTDPSQ
ncbi:hypothetical protein PGT21_005360 [Puccinia graminis f. sp. tritici]|uniref:Uncharacterized protein n=1 Tax=Puccinia graminis f. sp. tritici TaxID=56615 RepID=A0A5B0PPA4_PUCGR|nr:hypothetical protein PGT21_005360 [Puccinia graminis f. sp. tritici]